MVGELGGGLVQGLSGLVLVALAGSLFLYSSYYHRFKTSVLEKGLRASLAIAYGLWFLLLAKVLRQLLLHNEVSLVAWSARNWGLISPVPSVPASFYLAVLLGLAGGVISNVLRLAMASNRDYLKSTDHPLWSSSLRSRMKLAVLGQISLETGDPKVRIVWRALTQTKLVMVTLKTGKVYVGTVAASVDPSEDAEWLKIVPIASGFREKETYSYIPTTDYRSLFDAMSASDYRAPPEDRSKSDNKWQVDLADLGMLVAWSEVVSLTLYNPALEEYFQSQNDQLAGDDRPK